MPCLTKCAAQGPGNGEKEKEGMRLWAVTPGRLFLILTAATLCIQDLPEPLTAEQPAMSSLAARARTQRKIHSGTPTHRFSTFFTEQTEVLSQKKGQLRVPGRDEQRV